jgi:hypothetical protein
MLIICFSSDSYVILKSISHILNLTTNIIISKQKNIYKNITIPLVATIDSKVLADHVAQHVKSVRAVQHLRDFLKHNPTVLNKLLDLQIHMYCSTFM